MQVFFKYAFMPTRGLNAGNALKEENMNETVNQENMTNQNAGTEEQSRTFTVITPTVFVPLFSRLSCYCNDTTYDIL